MMRGTPAGATVAAAMARPTVLVLARAQDRWLPKLASLDARAHFVAGDAGAIVP